MGGKARVHELAKELGVTSKEILAQLAADGESAKSASSTIKAPVARRLRESLGVTQPAPTAAPVRLSGGQPAPPPPSRKHPPVSGRVNPPCSPPPMPSTYSDAIELPPLRRT